MTPGLARRTANDPLPGPPAVVLGGGQNQLAVSRSLGRRGIRVIAVHHYGSDIALSSRFCLPVVAPDPILENDRYVDFLIGLASLAGSKPVLIPTGDVEVLVISRYRDRLQRYFSFRMAGPDTIESLVNKRKFAELARAHGLPVPLTYLPPDEGSVRALSRELRYPCVIKPAYSAAWGAAFQRRFAGQTGGWIKRIVVHGPNELQSTYSAVAEIDPDLVIQEYIEGDDRCLYDVYTYLSRESSPLATFMIRKTRTLPIDGNGLGTCVESVWEERLARLSIGFLTSIGYTGNSVVCFKQCARTGRFYCLEVNARLGLHHGLASRCGSDLPFLAYLDALGQARPTARSRPGLMKWLSIWDDWASFRQYRRRGQLTFLDWVRSVRGAKIEAFWASDDPVPFLRKSMRALGAGANLWRVRRLCAAAERWLIPCLYHSGGLSRVPFLRRKQSPGLVILMYHDVGVPRWMLPALYVSERNFESQVKFLRSSCRPIPLERALELMSRGDSLPRNAVAVTFDDGYRGNYEKALPILEKYRCPATIFVSTEGIETGRPLWQNRLRSWFKTSGVTELGPSGNSGATGNDEGGLLMLRTEQDRELALRVVDAQARRLDSAARERFLIEVATRLRLDPHAPTQDEVPMLTWDQLREMIESGVSIGSHTMTHPVLTVLSRKEAMRELTESRRAIEQRLKRSITLFAYPFGEYEHFSTDVFDMVRAAGYQAACTAVEGLNRAHTSPFALHRVYVPDEGAAFLAYRLSRLARQDVGKSLW